MSNFLVLIEFQSIIILWLTLSSSSSSSSSSSPWSPSPSPYPADPADQVRTKIAKPNCAEDCGGIRIPYPFGIGLDCFHHPFYEIVCNNSGAFLKHYNLQVADIQYPDQDYIFPYENQTLTVRAPPTYLCKSNMSALLLGVDFRGSPYNFSMDNDFLVKGCSGTVVIRDESGQIVSGCATACANASVHIDLTTCRGAGCCRVSPKQYQTQMIIYEEDEFDSYESTLVEIDGVGSGFYELITLDHARSTSATNTCTLVAAFIDTTSEENFDKLSDLSTVLTKLYWHVEVTYLKKIRHIHFEDAGHRIQASRCEAPYEGNPYLPNGCQRPAYVRPGCEKCKHHCHWNKTSTHYYCKKKSWLKQTPFLGFSTAMGLALAVLGCYWLYRFIKWRREIRRKAKYFKRNGGLLLQQQMSSSGGVVEQMTIFVVSELEKATDNFHESRVVGKGGQGTVYKGMLMDGRIVAIKKSTEVDEDQLVQFINEIVILSNINHRNVVKLLGCCLETEVPLLVYEFIPNGTLYEHIQDTTEDFHLSWKMRLQIAAESAGALSYLHSSSSAPIYHRDIKSSNILLDEKYRAKVSDFGTSRAINIEQTHVTTRVHGTYGYVDPEYFQSNQFNEKSDVYSFGVVLVELITGKNPICLTEAGSWKSLATEFLCKMESSSLFDIVDTRIMEEGKAEQFVAVAELARKCLNMNGKQRPTMKEVAMVLDRIKSPNPKERESVGGKCTVTEIKYRGSSSTRITDMFYSANDSFSTMSIEAQPLMFNT